MLNELSGFQSSDERFFSISLSFDVETRADEGGELVHRTYTFSYAEEWDTWIFSEFHEKRTGDTKLGAERDWSRSRHVMWHDMSETRTIDVPPEVADRLAEATGSSSVTIQVPTGSMEGNEYETVRTVEGSV